MRLSYSCAYTGLFVAVVTMKQQAKQAAKQKPQWLLNNLHIVYRVIMDLQMIHVFMNYVLVQLKDSIEKNQYIGN